MNYKKAYTLDANEPLSKALAILMDTGTAVFITKDGKYFGSIDDRNLRKGLSDTTNVKCESCAVKTPVLRETSDVHESISAFLDGKYKALPVVDENEKILGSASRLEVVEKILELNLSPNETAQNLMHSPVYSIEYSSKLADAKSKFKEKNVHKVLVVEKGSPRGILSTYDLSALLLKPKGRDSAAIISEVKGNDSLPVSELLRERIVSVDGTSSIKQTLEMMLSKQVSNVLVTRNGSATGVISTTDVFKTIKKDSRVKPSIEISGLHDEEDRRHYDDIESFLESTISKYSQFFTIENTKVHIKRGKSVYEASVHMDVNKKNQVFKYEAHNVKDLLHGLGNEIKTVLSKEKDKVMHPKRGFNE